MKKKTSDLVVGLVVFVALISLVAGIMWLKAFSLTRQTVQYTAVFSNIGGLQSGDPVGVNGLKQGVVSSIELHGSLVAVHFKLGKDIRFTDSSQISVKNIGLMGERKLEISLSSKGTLYTPNSDTVQQYIHGTFDSGIAEALGMLGNFMVEASELLDTVGIIISSTVGDQEFVDFFSRTVVRLDTIVDVVERIAVVNNHKVDHIVADLSQTATSLRQLIDANNEGLGNIVSHTELLTSRAADLMIDLDTLFGQVQTIVTKVDSGDGTIAQLINDPTLAEELHGSMGKLDTLLNEVRDEGLKLRVKLGFRKSKSEKE